MQKTKKEIAADKQRAFRFSQKDFPSWRKTNRKYALKKRYGLSIESYEAILDFQGQACAICRIKQKDLMGPDTHKVFHVDHCHKTGVVRGLLCNGCNRALGFLKESPEIALTAYIYLVAWIPGDKNVLTGCMDMIREREGK